MEYIFSTELQLTECTTFGTVRVYSSGSYVAIIEPSSATGTDMMA